MHKLLTRLIRARLALLAIILVVSGMVVLVFAKALTGAIPWLAAWPLSDIGSGLFTTGLLSILLDFMVGRLNEERQTEQLRAVLTDQASVMRDAVIEGFAVKPDDLKRVATPELLDAIATNVMTLRLGDAQFAREIYADIRDQAIKAPERWYDVDVQARLSTAVERNTSGVPLFDLTVQWEYTTVPSQAIRRFACVSDRDEFNDLRQDGFATSTWFMRPRPGLDASQRESYELLEFAVDGVPQPIRRSARKTGQTYSVRLSPDATSGESVRIRYVFKVRTPTWGHRLYLETSQPTRGLSLTVDYSATDIAELAVTDMVSTAAPAWVTRSPTQLNGRTLSVEVPGWLMPKSGFAFTWTLSSEQPRSERSEAA